MADANMKMLFLKPTDFIVQNCFVQVKLISQAIKPI